MCLSWTSYQSSPSSSFLVEARYQGLKLKYFFISMQQLVIWLNFCCPSDVMKNSYVLIFNINVKIFFCRWRSALLWRAFFTTAVVAIVLRALIDFCLRGKCGLFGKGGLIMFDVYSESVTYHLIDVPPVLTLGVIGGILGSLYNFLLDKVLRIYNLINE